MIEFNSTHDDIRTIFNKGVNALDFPHMEYVIRETDDKIVALRHYDYRFDIPKSKIVAQQAEMS
jgi:hypothetical protein